MIKASVNLQELRTKDIPKGFRLKKTWNDMVSVGTGGVELGLR